MTSRRPEIFAALLQKLSGDRGSPFPMGLSIQSLGRCGDRGESVQERDIVCDFSDLASGTVRQTSIQSA